MINENILSMFKSHINNPSFSIVITEIEQNEECGHDNLAITVHQIDKPLISLEENANVVSRKLNIKSELTVDDKSLYATKLLGYLSDEKPVKSVKSETGIVSHTLEFLDTKLAKQITVNFNKKYVIKPKIIVNTEKEYESLYTGFSIEYITEDEIIKDINNEEKVIQYYIGAILTFKNLKTKQNYPIISIIIIGNEEIDTISLRVTNENMRKGKKEKIIAKIKDVEGNLIKDYPINFYYTMED